MDGQPIDLGKLVSPGFISADPPGETFFAITTGEGGIASSIARAGGEVIVDAFGGINMNANSGSFVGIDSFADITIEAIGTGVADIVNAGTIAFRTTGAGSLTGVQTIQASGDGLNIFETTNNANVRLDIGGTVAINDGHTSATNGDGLTVSAEGIFLGFPLDPTSTFFVGAIENVSTINGVAYPPPPALTTGITDDLTQLTWTQIPMSSMFYIDYDIGTTVTGTTNIQCTTINSNPDTASSCWLINVTPDEATNGTVRFYCAADPGTYDTIGPLYISWLITNP